MLVHQDELNGNEGMAKKVSNPRFPHQVVVTRVMPYDPLTMVSPDEVKVVYEGKCRSYQKEYVSTTGEVMTSKRVISLPMRLQDWTQDTIILENDLVEVDYGSYKERGKVVDKQPNNLGTDIYWEYGRN